MGRISDCIIQEIYNILLESKAWNNTYIYTSDNNNKQIVKDGDQNILN